MARFAYYIDGDAKVEIKTKYMVFKKEFSIPVIFKILFFFAPFILLMVMGSISTDEHSSKEVCLKFHL